MIKLQKFLADRALAPSRRAAEKWILENKILVNNKPATIGQRVSDKDNIAINGKTVTSKPASDIKVLIYHKPIGEICSRSTNEANNTVFDKLPKLENGRWIMVGRLDVQSSGLLLFTQSGLLAQKLMHPKYELNRTYKVRIHGKIEESIQQKLCQGVILEDGLAKFETFKLCQSSKGANQWLEVSLKEGRNRIVRRMFAFVNIPLNRLMRLNYGPIVLPRELQPGHWQYLPRSKVSTLCKLVGLNASHKL
jgi:23S rRNA pseudouridine2605 synthase